MVFYDAVFIGSRGAVSRRKFIDTCDKQFDIIFADPPYDLPDFSKVPEMILGSSMLRPGRPVL